MTDRVRVDGKFFTRAGARFNFRGVTYGTFAPRPDGARYREREQVKLDFATMSDCGFTVVRTYTTPPDDVLDVAADWGLQLLPDIFYSDWRYSLGGSRRQYRRIAREAGREVRAAARRLADNDHVLALSLGNEVPADVLRWLGTDLVADTLRELADIIRDEDPERLVTYANYPTAEYLPLETLDFLTFNVFLEEPEAFRRYLTRLHHLAGDRPLVLGEIGLRAGCEPEDERRQAEVIDWQLETAVERGVAGTCVFAWTDEWWVGDAPVEGWPFGLTRADGSARPALAVAARWNERTVQDLDFPWPSMSVVVCAYNAAATLDECLAHTCELEYPDLEILVVDDGSTDATADIATRYQARFQAVRVIRIPHAGLSVARNEGYRQARGKLVAYLDSDAYPSPEWPRYVALGMDSRTVGGVGGPNLPPPDDPVGAQVVARSPGGPVHVLVSDNRAEHVPGCNMAFWRKTLEEVGGFDPVYTAAGDDVDLCWKVLDRNWEIGYHPAALVWHHRRPGLRSYLRQQRGYGRSEALVEARNPDRFTPAGTARWRGRIYNSLTPPMRRQPVYRGIYGSAAYQSVYEGGGHVLDLLHQLGVPAAALVALTAPLVAVSSWFGLPALVAAGFLAALMAVDVRRADPPRRLQRRRTRFRLQVALHHLLQPLVRAWGRSRARRPARKELPGPEPLPRPVRAVARGVLVLPEDRPRASLAAVVINELRRAGARVLPASGWEDYDARMLMSSFLYGDLQTSSHPVGYVQLRIRRRVRWRNLMLVAAVAAAAFAIRGSIGLEPLASDALIGVLGVVTMAETGRGFVRSRLLLRRAVPRDAATVGS